MGLTEPRQRAKRASLINSDIYESQIRPTRTTNRSLKRKWSSYAALLLPCTMFFALLWLVTLQPPSNTTRARFAGKPFAVPPKSAIKTLTPNPVQPEQIMEPKFENSRDDDKILTMYLEPTNSLPREGTKTLARRKTSAESLRKVKFPDVNDCSRLMQDFPIDDFPDLDPYLPWIHDYFVDPFLKAVKFVAQNKRRCETGDAKESIMKYWEPQISLFQSVPVKEQRLTNGTITYRLSTPEEATAAETRFLCRFHDQTGRQAVTLSEFPFNYEYISWRKHNIPMFKESGRDVDQFEFSQLMFSCPVPDDFRDVILQSHGNSRASAWLDLVPIRTPARKDYLLSPSHVGANEWKRLRLYSATQHFGHQYILPEINDSGRWANLPVCPPSISSFEKKPHRLVACTWSAASYQRRGDATTVNDSSARLKEWIAFHRLVGFDHIYLYDNTKLPANESRSPMEAIAAQFPGFVTYHPWPPTVCSNNRPNHKNPGERSSQYAAEASCRERYGPLTEWMTFIDTDEYLVPMRGETWHSVLEEKQRKQIHVLKMRSSRGRPRHDLMEILDDPGVCKSPSYQRLPVVACLTPRTNETFLHIYNCDYIKPPRPERFARAMKQIYRPDFVLSHFVHYSTVTRDIARTYNDTPNRAKFTREIQAADWGDAFLDELREGVLVHTKSVLPHETMTRNATCFTGSKRPCGVGYVCPDSTKFDDSIHQKNIFVNEKGKYCNCWVNQHLEQKLIPKLDQALKNL